MGPHTGSLPQIRDERPDADPADTGERPDAPRGTDTEATRRTRGDR